MTEREKNELAKAARVWLRLEHAQILAKKSNFRQHKSGALVYSHDGDIVASGWGHYRELEIRKSHAQIHAEVHAILRCPSRLDRHNGRVYIARISAKTGEVANAMPCNDCLAIMVEAGISEVFYSIDSENFGYLPLT